MMRNVVRVAALADAGHHGPLGAQLQRDCLCSGGNGTYGTDRPENDPRLDKYHHSVTDDTNGTTHGGGGVRDQGWF